MRKVRSSLLVSVAMLFTVACIVLVALVYDQVKRQALWEAEEKAKMTLDRNLAVHTYFTHQLKPKVFEMTDKVMPEGYFDPVWMSSTHAVREMDKYYKSIAGGDYYYKECAINARSPQNEADEYEKKIILQMNADPGLKKHQAVRDFNGKPFLVVLRRGEVMEKACLRCHSEPEKAPKGLIEKYGGERSFQRQYGELVSAISIRVPLSAAYGRAYQFAWRLSIMLLAVLAAIVGFLFLISRRIFLRPLAAMRAQAERIGGDPENIGEHIKLDSYEEWNQMAQAFNDMSDRLRLFQEDLEGRVRQRTKELRASEEQYRLLADNTLDLIWTMNLDLEITYINPACYDLTGYTVEEWIGSHLAEHFDKDDFAKMKQVIADELIRGPESSGAIVEGIMLKKNRERIPVEIHGKVIYGDSGQPIGLQGTTRDISERKQSEESLRQSQKRYLELFENMSSGVAVYEAKGQGEDFVFKDINQVGQRMSKVTKDRVVGRSVLDCFPGVKEFGLFEVFQEVWRSGRPRQHSTGFYQDQNISRWYENYVYKLPTGEIVAVYDDVTERKNFEETLKASESLLNDVGKMAKVGGWEIDTRTMEVTWTEETYRIHEVPLGVKTPLEDAINFFHPEERSQLRQAIQEALAHGRPYDLEIRFITAKGKHLWTRTICKPIVVDGEVVKLQGIFQDITDRKKIEDAIKKSEEELRWLFKSMINSFVIFESVFDDDGRFVSYRFAFINDAYEQVTGVKAENVIGKTVHEVWPETEPEWIKRYGEVAVTGVSQTFDLYHGPTNKIYHCNVYRPWDTSDRFCVVFQDITERKKAEQAIRDGKAQLELAIAASNAGLWDWDLETNKVYFSPEWKRQIGHEFDEISDDTREWESRVHPDDLKAALKSIRSYLKNPWPDFELEYRFRHKDGSYRWMLARARLLYDDEKKPIRMVGLHLDVTERKQAEQAILKSKVQLELAVKASSVGLWDWDLTTNKVYFSPEWKRQIGYEMDEISDAFSEWQSRVHPDDLDRSLRTVRSFIEKPWPDYELEFRFRHKDGSYRWILTRASLLYDDEEKPIRMVGLHLDVTERKQAEQALRESEERYRATFDQAPVGVAHLGLDGKYMLVNQRLCKILGYSHQDLLKMTTYELTYPDDRETALLLHGKIRSREIPGYSREKRYLRKDGTLIWAHVTVSPAWDSNGLLKHIIIAVQDITERKSAEEALREQEILLNEVGQIAKIGGWEMDLVTRKAKWTKATYDIVEVEPGQPIPGPDEHVDYYLPEYRPMIREAMRALEQDDRPLEFEARLRTAKGNIKWCRALGRAEKRNGKCVRLYGTFQDITERKRIEEEKAKLENQLLRAQKLEAIGTLAGGIAHDFNNILSAQLGYTELALKDLHDNPQLQDLLNRAMRASRRGVTLVKQILSFSQHGEQENRPVRVYLIVREVLEMIRATIPTTIEIKQNLKGDSETILGDSSQIHQVIMNLCTNAAQAMEEKGGILEVTLDSIRLDEDDLAGLDDLKPGDYQRLTVRDTGHGMDQKTVERIFDPFFTTKGEGKGTGLGLSVVYGIVQGHGGTVKVHSEPGQGTVFQVYFPLFEGKMGEEEGILPKGPLPTGTEHILLVDDEEMLVDVGGQTLTRLGYKVTGCTSSPEALALLKAAPDDYDLLITDFTMPKMTGDVLAMEALAVKPDLPIILYTGYSEQIDKKRAFEIGIKRFLIKPVDDHVLAQAVRSLIHAARDKALRDGSQKSDKEK